MAKVWNQSIPPSMLASGKWPFNPPPKYSHVTGPISTPTLGQPTLRNAPARQLWQLALDGASDLLTIHPGAGTYASVEARRIATITELYAGTYNPAVWVTANANVDQILTTYDSCTPQPAGGPLAGQDSAWFRVNTNAGEPVAPSHYPGMRIAKAGTEYNYLYRSARQIAWPSPGSRHGWQAPPTRIILTATIETVADAMPGAAWLDLYVGSAWGRYSSGGNVPAGFPGKSHSGRWRWSGIWPTNTPPGWHTTLTRQLTVDPLYFSNNRGYGLADAWNMAITVAPYWTRTPHIFGATLGTSRISLTAKMYQLKM